MITLNETTTTLIVGFASTILHQFVLHWRDRQDRKEKNIQLSRDLEVRSILLDSKLQSAAIELAEVTAEQAHLLRQVTEEHINGLQAKLDDANIKLDTSVTKIDENTQISREAFKEANDVNRKIADNQSVIISHQKSSRHLSDLESRVSMLEEIIIQQRREMSHRGDTNKS